MAGTGRPTARVRQLAAGQAGVVSRVQVLCLGMSDAAIRRRLLSHEWVRVHPGVYTTWPDPPSNLALVWAALLHAGADAIAGHETAAWLDGFGEWPEIVDITVPHPQRPRSRLGVRVFRTTAIDERRHPAKSPPRTRVEETVLDLAERAARLDDLVALISRVCRSRLTSPDRIRAAADRRKKLRWRGELIAILADVAAGTHALLEHRYLVRVERAHRLPRGRRQHAIRRGSRTEYKDVYYDEPYHVVVELDGPVGHSSDLDRLRDMARDNADTLDGRLVLRYGFQDVERRPCEIAAQVARALRQRGWRGRPRQCGPHCHMHDQGR